MTAHLAAGALLLLGAALVALPAWHLLSRLDDAVHERRRLRKRALDEAMRQEMELHPVGRSDWEPYRMGREARP